MATGLLALALNLALTHVGCQAALPFILKAFGLLRASGAGAAIARKAGGAIVHQAGHGHAENPNQGMNPERL